ncbi:Ferrichrome-iron receptor precursor [Marinomonas gallaica]|uniref:Ferrichrome-iron receptor n=1 Tax=Marinomonas gallaica TaxID=1806667 RepID=A0A1C3JTH3_9GAMM|nr:TonB-dependent siderophore receptor [Marinomonas gallaica]SBT18523.1 Ferrichrome-iron receptor precursor [Marinomonas gallaica]SBT22768.1 Ferrichrome-iron receptor precursor [Marinomonas gallaica]
MKITPLACAIRNACAVSLITTPVLAMAEDVNSVQLDTLSVYGTDLGRYEFDEANSATGFNADVNDLPRAVQVLPEQLILDQKAETLEDVLQNVAAITRAHGFGGTESQVNIRGFQNSHLFVDGNPVSNRFNVDVATIDRVEVILGPASVLHGQVSPGGLINIITKKPQVEDAHSVQLDLDEYGQQKLTVDSTGSLSDKVQYRVIVAQEDSESYREVRTEDGDHADKKKALTIAPSLSYTPDADNTFTISFLHAEQNLPIDRGTVAVENGEGGVDIADIPVGRRLGSRYDERDSTEQKVQFDFDHYFQNGWKNQLKLGYYEKEFDDYQARPYRGLNDNWTQGTGAVDFSNPANLLELRASQQGSAVSSNGLLLRTADSNLDVTEDSLFISDSLTGDYYAGGINNTLYVGANVHQRNVKHSDGFGLVDVSNVFGAGVYAPALDVVDIYSDSNPAYSKVAQTKVSTNDAQYTEMGFSIQNLSYVNDKFNVLAGLRYDRYEIDRNDTIYFQNGSGGTFLELDEASQVKLKGDNDNISGQLGAMYRLSDEFSVYASWSESFTPNYPDVTAGQVTGSNDMAPEEATQYEIGLKSSLMDEKLRLTASVYQLERKNVMTFENLLAKLNGEEETKGVELTATMQFMPGLNVLASYANMDAEIVDDNDDTVDREGNTPYGIPEQKARIWGSYEVQDGSLKSLGIGLGAEYVSSRYGNDDNSFKLPSYTIYDVASWYYIPVGDDQQLRLQAGIKNLTDETYYPANLGNAFRINVGDPRTFYMSARMDF